MSDNEVAIVVVAIVFGSILGIVGLIMLTKLIKAWINRNKNTYDEEKFERLAKAFIQQKKRTERRLKKLETGESEQKIGSAFSEKSKKKEYLQEELEINPKEEEAQPKTSGGSLNNMLRQE